jgi:SAUR family protein
MANKISQIVRLKQVMQRWKTMSLRKRSVSAENDDVPSTLGSNRRVPSGSLGVYVGIERRRFLIPTRFLNLPVFVDLLNMAEEEFGFQSNGGLVFPCEVVFFKAVLRSLDRDEARFGGLGFDDFARMLFPDAAVADYSCKDSLNVYQNSSYTPVLQKARV